MTPDQTPPQAPVQPMLRVPDVAKALDVYKEAGFNEVGRFPGPDGKTLAHGMIGYGSSVVHLGPLEMEGMEQSPDYDAEYESRIRQGPRGLGVVLYVNVPDVANQLEKCKRAGFEIKTPLRDQFYGDRTFGCVDPFGYYWSFAQTVKQMTPDEMQQAMDAMGAR